jgi:hypothetical protein
MLVWNRRSCTLEQPSEVGKPKLNRYCDRNHFQISAQLSKDIHARALSGHRRCNAYYFADTSHQILYGVTDTWFNMRRYLHLIRERALHGS